MTLVSEPAPVLRWLGGKIDVQVRIESALAVAGAAQWDIAEWDVAIWASSDLAYQDITPYVLEVTYQRGTESFDTRFQGGSATVECDNTTGLFTPSGTGEVPWSLPFRPGRRVQISCFPDPESDTRVILFTGRIDDTGDDFQGGGGELTTSLQLIDALAELGANNPPMLETATGVQPTDDRVIAALDYADQDSALRDIQTGLHTMQTSFLAQSTLEECQRAADAEGGAFYAEPDGTMVFKARDWLSTDARSTTVQGYLGFATIQDPTVPHHNIDSDSVQTSWNLARVRNDIQFSRDGGAQQHVWDDDSIVRHGRRTYRRTDYNNNSDSEVLFLANRVLDAALESRMRVTSLAIIANDDPDNDDLNRLFYDTRMGDLFAVELRTLHDWEIPEFQTHVIGIAGRITADEWVVTFTLDDSLVEGAA